MNTYTKKSKGSLALRKKLFSAAAMLLVASIMLVSTSYAWLVLSTAPEITGISTKVGANGALEIVLLNTDTYADVNLIPEMDIDESVVVETSNEMWGNLLDLGDSSYGLSQIALNPSRLNIAPLEGTTGAYAVGSITPALLKIPIYNEDGRIVGLDHEAAIATTYREGFTVDGNTYYGVRGIGTVASMTAAQSGLIGASNTLSGAINQAKNAARSALQDNGGALGKIAIKYVTGGAYSDADLDALISLAEDLEVALDHIDTGIRQVYVGYINSTEVTLTEEEYKEAKAEIENKETTLEVLQAKYDGVTIPAAPGGDIIDLLNSNKAKLTKAINDCEAMKGTSFTGFDIMKAMSSLVDPDKMTLGGKTIDEVKAGGIAGIMGAVGSGLELTVPTGSGIVSDIADFAGNYDAAVTVENVEYDGQEIGDVPAKMKTQTSVSPTYLAQCLNIISRFTAGGASDVIPALRDFFGYVLDFAVRTNAADSELLLQTDSAQRIYSGSNNAATQGGGSYMRFEFDGNTLSAGKMLKLMSALRVVFMDEENKVLGIAALETVGQDNYTVLADGTASKYAVLTLPAGEVAQNSDYISQAEYNSLPETGAVEFITETSGGAIATVDESGEGGTDGDTGDATDGGENTGSGEETGGTTANGAKLVAIKAPMYLRAFSMTESTNHGDDATQTYYTGGITLGEKLDSNVIMALEENVATKISTLVYLDGSHVFNSMVAAESETSMTGTMNLQFSSSANLMPMNNQALFDGEEPTVDETT